MKTIVRNPILGWYPNVPIEEMNDQAWVEALNVRFRNNAVERIKNSGQFGNQDIQYYKVVNPAPNASVATADPILGFGQFMAQTGTEYTVMFSQHEIYEFQGLGLTPWDTDADDRLTPHFADIGGSLASCVAGTTVTGNGSDWDGTIGTDTDNLPQAGDWIKFNGFATWYQIRSITDDDHLELVGNGPNTAGDVAYDIRLMNGSTRTIGHVPSTDAITAPERTGWIIREFDYLTDDTGAINPAPKPLIATNGYNSIQVWGGTGKFEFLAGTNYLEDWGGARELNMRCRAMAVFKNTLFVGDTSECNAGNTGFDVFPFRLRWSNLGLPAQWRRAALGDQANYQDIPDDSSKIVALETLGDDLLIIYKERSIWAATFIGVDNGVVNVQKITGKQGCASRRAIASNGQVHCFCNSENIYLLYGTQIIPIGNPIKDYWKARYNRHGKDNIQVTWRPDMNEFWIIFTGEPGSCPTAQEALILSLSDGAWNPAVDNQLAPPKWSHVELPDCSAVGSLALERGLTWDEVNDTWDDIDLTWDEMTLDTTGYYIWGDLSGNTWYMEKDVGDGAVVARKGLLQTRMFAPDTFSATMLRAGQFNTDSTNETVGWWIGISDYPDANYLTWYGRDGIIDGAKFRYLHGNRVDGIKIAAPFYAMKCELTADSPESDVRIYGYQWVFIPKAVRR